MIGTRVARRRVTRRRGLALVLAMALVAAACSSGSGDTSTTEAADDAVTTAAPADDGGGTATEDDATPPAEGGEDIVIGLSLNSRASAIFVALAGYLVDYSATYGEEIGRNITVVETVADDDPTRQNADIDDLISQGVDAIIAVSIDDTAIGAGIEAAQEAGIPFITYGRPVAEGVTEPDAHVGIDSVDQAYVAAVELAKVVSADGESATCIELQGDLRDVNAKNRSDGWARGIEESGGTLTSVAILPGEWKADVALSLLTTSLQANPDANCMFVASDFYLDAVTSALELEDKWAPRGEDNHVYLATQDVFPQGVTFLEEGFIDIDVNFPVAEQMVEAVHTAVKLVDGESLSDAERFSLVRGGVLTPDNIATTDNLWGRDYADQ